MLTCYTYRQAAWAPDWTWSTNWSSAISSTVQTIQLNAANITSRTGTAAGATTFLQVIQTGTNATGITNVGTGSQQGAHFAPVFTASSRIGIGSTISFTSGPGGVTTNTTTNSSNWLLALGQAHQTVSITSTQAGTFINGTSSAGTTLVYTYGTTTICPLTTTSTITPTSITTAANTAATTVVSTSGLSSSSTASTSSTTGKTSIASTVTTTATYAMGANATTTATTTYTRWTISLSTASLVTATTTTSTLTNTTVAFTGQTTSTVTAVTPSWWGWSMETGTLLMATGNIGANDLPAWLEMSNWVGSLAALWNFSTATQTTLWPAPPIGIASGVTTQTATGTVASITQTVFASYTLFGTSTYSTTTTLSAVPPLSTDGSYDQMTTPLPITERSQVVTSYTTVTVSTIGLMLTPINTSTYHGNDTSNYTPVISTFVISNIASTISFPTTISFTTLTSGYTTAVVATGTGEITSYQTVVITAPGIALTTTTSTDNWFMDWSCPTQVASTTTGSTTTTTLFGTATQTRTTLQTSGRSQGFTQNVFQSPYWVLPPVTTVSAGVQIYLPANVKTWACSPAMQGWSPWTNTSATYLSVVGPAGLSMLPLQPLQSGSFLSIDPLRGPATTAQSGLWGFVASPVTAKVSASYTTTTTAGAGTTTLTHNVVQVTGYSWGTSAGNSTTATALTISFPSNMDQALASFTAGATFTTTTTAPGGTTTAKSSTSGSGITLSLSTAATFPASAAYTLQSVQPITVTATSTFLSGTTTQTQVFWVSTNVTVTDTRFFTGSPLFQFVEGAGPGQVGGGPATFWIGSAAVLFYGTNSSTTSIAALNLAEVVVGGSFTTTSSANSAGYPQYTLTGVASWVTSPLYWILTNPNRFSPALTTATNFWVSLNPVIVPLQATNPSPAHVGNV